MASSITFTVASKMGIPAPLPAFGNTCIYVVHVVILYTCTCIYMYYHDVMLGVHCYNDDDVIFVNQLMIMVVLNLTKFSHVNVHVNVNVNVGGL